MGPDPGATAALVERFRQALGEDSVVEIEPVMGSEDFGALGAAIGVPSVFWFFGGHDAATLEGAGPVPVNHSPFIAPAIEPTLSTGVRAALTAILARVGR